MVAIISLIQVSKDLSFINWLIMFGIHSEIFVTFYLLGLFVLGPIFRMISRNSQYKTHSYLYTNKRVIVVDENRVYELNIDNIDACLVETVDNKNDLVNVRFIKSRDQETSGGTLSFMFIENYHQMIKEVTERINNKNITSVQNIIN